MFEGISDSNQLIVDKHSSCSLINELSIALSIYYVNFNLQICNFLLNLWLSIHIKLVRKHGRVRDGHIGEGSRSPEVLALQKTELVITLLKGDLP
jgi:hypothetical protein